MRMTNPEVNGLQDITFSVLRTEYAITKAMYAVIGCCSFTQDVRVITNRIRLFFNLAVAFLIVQ